LHSNTNDNTTFADSFRRKFLNKYTVESFAATILLPLLLPPPPLLPLFLNKDIYCWCMLPPLHAAVEWDANIVKFYGDCYNFRVLNYLWLNVCNVMNACGAYSVWVYRWLQVFTSDCNPCGFWQWLLNLISIALKHKFVFLRQSNSMTAFQESFTHARRTNKNHKVHMLVHACLLNRKVKFKLAINWLILWKRQIWWSETFKNLAPYMRRSCM